MSEHPATSAGLPYPVDEPRVHVAGSNPDLVVFIGTGPIGGIGVSSHRSGLAGQAARQISTLTGRGVDAEIYPDNSMTIRSAVAALARVRLNRYDAIVVAVGLNDVFVRTPLTVWRSGMTAMLNAIESALPEACCVFVLGIGDPAESPLFRRSIAAAASLRAREFNRISEELIALRPSATFLEIKAGPPERGLQAYTAESHVRWASQISGPIAASLDRAVDAGNRRGGYRADAEPQRQAAVEKLRIVDTQPEDRFDRIVRMASVLLKTPTAVLAIIDRDRVFLKSRVGVELSEVDRTASLCTTTITERGGLEVDDASIDPRFASSPLVTGDLHLRYYQGYPIESVDGYPVGALCVFDSQPRRPEENSMNVLRDLALLIQGELAR